MRYIKIFLAAIIALSFTSCKSVNTFNPYFHMSRILTMTTAEQFATDRDEILAHITPELQDEFINMLDGTIYDKKYSITERTCYVESAGNTVKLIGEYECTATNRQYIEVVYFEYLNDILVDYDIQYLDRIYAEEGIYE